jgi:hypothetical protein
MNNEAKHISCTCHHGNSEEHTDAIDDGQKVTAIQEGLSIASPVLGKGMERISTHSLDWINRNQTFTKPIAADFSRKHWRQRSRPYFRMRPAWCAQRRLVPKIVKTLRFTLNGVAHHWRLPFPYFRGRENQTASWVIFGLAV